MVSIGVMAYNQEQYVRQTMDCLLAQQCSYPFEIVIGDDGSVDNTRAILEEYQQKHPDIIRMLPKAPNKGILKNYTDIIRASTGKYIAFCHCDDLWHDPLKLQKQVTFLEGNPDYGMVHTNADVYLENSDKTIRNFNDLHQPNIPSGDVFEAFLTNKFFIFTVTGVFSKAAIEKYVDLDEFIRVDFMYEDLPTWLALSYNTKVKYMNESTSTYRVITNSHSHPKEANKKFVLLRAHYKMKKHFIAKYNVNASLERDFDISHHVKKFNLAYKLNNFSEAKESYDYLKSQGQVNMKMTLKKMMLGMPFVYNSFNRLKRVYTPKTSVSNL